MNKTCIITGGTSGIGLETARILAQQNHNVIILARSREKGEVAVAQLIESTNNKKIQYFEVDLSSKQSIIDVCGLIREKLSAIDVLINNAAYISSYHQLNDEGIELQMAVNHYAPIHLIKELLPLLIKSTGSRIIQVTSRAHARGKIWWDDINLKKKYSLSKSYNQSKLANLIVMYKIAELLNGTGVTVNSYHPGLVNTEIGDKHTSFIEKYAWKGIKILGRSPKKAAEDAIYLALSDRVKDNSGGYFHNKKQIQSSKASYDINLRNKLWKHSCRISGIAEHLINTKL